MNRQVSIFDEKQPQGFFTELTQFSDFGENTEVKTQNDIPYFINEFWTAKQRQAHKLHEISYRACFKPQLPEFFIERLTSPGDIVYDPFMGRGTTLLQAALSKRVPYGNDTNPLSKAFIEPRLDPPSLEQVSQRLSEIPWDSFVEFENEDLLVFYHPKTLAQIEGLRSWLLGREVESTSDNIDAWIKMVAINRLTGHSSGFFSVYTLPPNQAVSVKRQKAINEKRQQEPEERNVVDIILKKSKVLLSQLPPKTTDHLLLTRQSHDTPQIKSNSVSLTVTSPPFLDIVDYEADNWLRCWFIGVDPKAVEISMHHNITTWQSFITDTLAELSRITRVGGHIAFEVGEVRKGTIRLEDNVIAASQGLPLDALGVVINQQDFTKTSNCWGISNNKGGTNSNRIVLLQKR